VLGAAAPLSAFAQAPAAPTGNAERGKAIFIEHCGVCHGDRGKGNGIAASSLRTRPTNLATLAKRSGAFPADRVDAVLRGKAPVTLHGTDTMMIWGAVFLADANGNSSIANQRIADVVEFIRSIQTR
jgi:cytochrome c551/c552